MERASQEHSYLERKRKTILDFGYDCVRFRSRTKKSLVQLKSIIKNNVCHFEGVLD
ncbi:hypothetical protein MTsPCn5_04860 [Croceitalea sp. MTPC5]|uniref:hypothetical protein n=1 Tax=Croceitalea sp. MTPC5 TaxID=3056565 RepID=UPI002B3A8851|nr:hypothetical protein MTsPCn5_04860 [Croceitalea sp. MTPC5]